MTTFLDSDLWASAEVVSALDPRFFVVQSKAAGLQLRAIEIGGLTLLLVVESSPLLGRPRATVCLRLAYTDKGERYLRWVSDTQASDLASISLHQVQLAGLRGFISIIEGALAGHGLGQSYLKDLHALWQLLWPKVEG